MIFPVALLAAFILFPATLGSEESCYLSEEQEDECASVCYPIVKPLLRYFEKSSEKDVQLSKCKTDYLKLQKQYSDLGLEKYDQISKFQKDYSDLVKSNREMQSKYTEVLRQLSDEKVKYAQMQTKQQEVDNLINQKNKEIEVLNDHNRYLTKTCELATITNKLSNDIDKIGELVKAGEVLTNQLAHIKNKTKSKKQNIDPCPRNQKEGRVLREIQLPGSDSFKVVCVSDSEFGSGWLNVYRKLPVSNKFNRTYEDYERGFGDVEPLWNDEFFIGLKRLHILTKGNPHEVLLNTNNFKQKICGYFVVGDRRKGYEVKNIGNCTGDDVWMIPKQGSKFSTWDRDEDGVPDRNLAKELDFGWWFDPGMRPMGHQTDFIDLYIRQKIDENKKYFKTDLENERSENIQDINMD